MTTRSAKSPLNRDRSPTLIRLSRAACSEAAWQGAWCHPPWWNGTDSPQKWQNWAMSATKPSDQPVDSESAKAHRSAVPTHVIATQKRASCWSWRTWSVRGTDTLKTGGKCFSYTCARIFSPADLHPRTGQAPGPKNSPCRLENAGPLKGCYVAREYWYVFFF
jgi:hypothetical protein